MCLNKERTKCCCCCSMTTSSVLLGLLSGSIVSMVGAVCVIADRRKLAFRKFLHYSYLTESIICSVVGAILITVFALLPQVKDSMRDGCEDDSSNFDSVDECTDAWYFWSVLLLCSVWLIDIPIRAAISRVIYHAWKEEETLNRVNSIVHEQPESFAGQGTPDGGFYAPVEGGNNMA